MSRPSQGVSVTTTLLFCLLLFVALFPAAFHYFWTLPFSIIRLLPSQSPKPLVPEKAATMTWFQKQITLQSKSRGSYLITDQVVSSLPEIRDYKVGLLNLFMQHTSCALSLNENCAWRI